MAQLDKSIHDATDYRGRDYQMTIGLALSFAADDTDAAADALRFQRSCYLHYNIHPKMVALPNVDSSELRNGLAYFLRALKAKASEVAGQSLVIIYYAGHAGMSEDGELYLVANPSSVQRVFFEATFSPLWRHEDEFQRTDVIIVLDSCFPSNAARYFSTVQHRTVEIVAAAAEPDQSNALGNSFRYDKSRPSFTAMLEAGMLRAAGPIARVAGSVSMRDIIAFIRSNSEGDPQYQIKLGSSPISFAAQRSLHPFVRQQLRFLNRGPPPAVYGITRPPPSSNHSTRVRFGVIFTATMDKYDPEDEEHKKTMVWLHFGAPALGVYPENVEKSRTGHVVTFHGEWAIWAVLKGLKGFRFECETFGEDLLSAFP